MSVDYFIINKRISKKEIMNNTDLKIKSQDNGDWIVDKYNNAMLIVEGFYRTDENGEHQEIKDDIIRELTAYAGSNPKYILDTCQIDDKYEEFVIEDMGKIGHKIIDYVNSIVEVPERLEEEYLRF